MVDQALYCQFAAAQHRSLAGAQWLMARRDNGQLVRTAMYLGSSELDPKKLIYFVTVIESGSLKKAAKVLDVSQPALSASMSRLEADVGQKLMERGHSGVVPTRFGDLIYAHARLIRDELKLLERHLLDRRHQEDPAIRFGALPSLSVTVIPKAVSRWRVKYPSESLQISQKVQIELLHALLGRELDVMVGVTDSYDLLSGLKQRVLFRESLHVIARADHALFLKPDLGWADLVVFPWVSPPAGRYNTLLEDVLKGEGLSPPSSNTVSSSISMLKSLVASSDCLALLPRHAALAEIREGLLGCLSISSPHLKRNIALFMREGYEMQPAHRDLVEDVRLVGMEVSRECESCQIL
ncbi:LysR family transcriptional regulator [Rhizobium sp. Leaf386]|uniref:LysR family transcriptional regulator n=1 Tax=Rhizobium sp. Leaf386 TaxID=1736359 RepID=UPI001FCD6373|nr:LysR family transcriptional regulator [Rhizobium sp. Leaf386]